MATDVLQTLLLIPTPTQVEETMKQLPVDIRALSATQNQPTHFEQNQSSSERQTKKSNDQSISTTGDNNKRGWDKDIFQEEDTYKTSKLYGPCFVETIVFIIKIVVTSSKFPTIIQSKVPQTFVEE